MAAACLACHGEIAEQRRAGTGVHGSAAAAGRCADCHGEHHGASPVLFGPRAFERLGVEEPDAYDHRHVPGFPLTGVHEGLACSACHEHAGAAVLAPGEHRFLGAPAACRECHDDPHDGTMGTDCAGCHGQSQPFDRVARFEHDPRFALEGAHAGHACRVCHEPGGPRAVARLLDDGASPSASSPASPRSPDAPSPPGSPGAVRRCADCHADPHRRAFTEGRDCTGCHAAAHGTFAAAAESLTAAEHASSGFPLVPPHDDVGCASCHGAGAGYAERHPGRDPQDCARCHGDPHAGQFDHRPQGGRCTSCHERARFVPGLFGLQEHAGTALPLDGAHRELDCAACHREEDGVRRFAGTPAACASCHGDPHGGQFDGRPHGGRCSACHGTAHFVPSRFDLARHRHARFPLTGAHRAVACAACHEPRQDGTRHFIGTPRDCASCHDDPHAGRFDAPGRPATVEGRRGCARCHDTGGFAAVTWDAGDHARWTGHRLAGAHARADCTACHDATAPGPGPGPAPRDCASCHEDVHLGQFRRDGATDCARCHDPAAGWNDLVFDHQRDSRFPLDRAHRRLSCSACHRPWPAGEGGVVRYRPLGRECRDCHGPPGRGGKR